MVKRAVSRAALQPEHEVACGLVQVGVPGGIGPGGVRGEGVARLSGGRPVQGGGQQDG